MLENTSPPSRKKTVGLCVWNSKTAWNVVLYEEIGRNTCQIAGILWAEDKNLCTSVYLPLADVGNSSMPNGWEIPTAGNGFESISYTELKKVQTQSSNGMFQPFCIVFFCCEKCIKKIWGKAENVEVAVSWKNLWRLENCFPTTDIQTM